MDRRNSLFLLLAAALAATWTNPGSAETVYRCGESYSQQPCPGGRPVQADDPRTAEQRKQTLEAVRRDAKSADAMEQSRLKEEAKPAQPPIGSNNEPKPGQSADADNKTTYYKALSSPKKVKAKAQAGKKKKKAKKPPSL